MPMELVQVRLPSTLVTQVERFVKKGCYASKSDVIRDAIRILVFRSHIGSIPNTGDSVQEVREIRKQLSKLPFDIDEINKL